MTKQKKSSATITAAKITAAGLIIAAVIAAIASNAKIRHSEGNSPQQTTSGNDNTPMMTTGPNSPIYNIATPQDNEHKNIRSIASYIYIEVLGAVKNLRNLVESTGKEAESNLSKIRFSQQYFRNYYQPGMFNKPDLDGQLGNFYNCLNSIDSQSKKQDFQRALTQGENILQIFSADFGFGNFDNTGSGNASLELYTNTVSADVATIRQQKIIPTIIFDSNGSILNDLGGLEYIEKIEVVPHQNSMLAIPSKVILTPKIYLATAPILTPVDPAQYLLSTKRGSNLDWEYILEIRGSNYPSESKRFRLEIIK